MVKETAIQSVIYTADSGYYFPENYSVSGAGSGITVTRDSISQITVSGTPTGNVSITLAAATEIGGQEAPNQIGEEEGQISGTTTEMEYRKKPVEGGSDTGWTDCANGATPVEPGTYEVRYKETETQKAGDVAVITVKARYMVTVTNPAGSHITRSTKAGNGAENQKVAAAEAMTAIIYTADSGYYFPENYSVSGKNGVKVTRNSASQITVSGNITGNVSITLAAAKKKTVTNQTTTETKEPKETVTSAQKKKNSIKLNIGMFVGWKKNKFTVSWGKVEDAEGYDIFSVQCGNKLALKSLVKTVKGNHTSTTLEKIAGKKVSGKKTYKVVVRAYKTINGKKVYIGVSKTYHAAGKDSKTYTNAKEVKLSKESVKLKVGKSSKIKATIVKQSKKKKLLSEKHGAPLRYFSTDESIAKVTAKGKIKAKKKGTCYIYITALNGVKNRVEVTVK